MLSRVSEIAVAPIASKMDYFLLSKEDDNDGAKSGHYGTGSEAIGCNSIQYA